MCAFDSFIAGCLEEENLRMLKMMVSFLSSSSLLSPCCVCACVCLNGETSDKSSRVGPVLT